MHKKYFNYGASVLISLSVLFIIFYVAAREFAPLGSQLRQGYVGNQGNVNLSNGAVGALILLILSVIASKLIAPNQSKQTRNISKAGFIVLVLAGIWFLFVATVLLYALLTGRLLDGWQF